jgi:hypothetical protein
MRVWPPLAIVLIGVAACSQADMAAKRVPEPRKKQATASLCDMNTTPPADSNFPKGFDYPQAVAPWVQSGGGARMRLHAWCLFAGVNQTTRPNGPFLWQGWNTSTQAFPNQHNPWKGTDGAARPPRPAPLNSRNLANARVGGNNPINNPPPVYPVAPAVVQKYPSCLQPIKGHPGMYHLIDGARMQSNGDIMIAGVIYNDAAFKNITGPQQLYNAVALNALLPARPTSPAATILPFPSASIVLKPMFWPVQKGAFTALPVWDWDAHKPGSAADGRYAGYEMQAFWSRAVAITDLPNPTPPPTVTYLYGAKDSTGTQPLAPITYDNTAQTAPPAFRIASVNQFYHRQLTQSDLDQLAPCDRALLDASAWWAYNRAFTAGDYLVLIAMHIMTKEQPNWTFQTLWWHPDAANSSKCGRYCEDRPTNLTDTTFRNYLLTTTYGTAQQTTHHNYYAPPGTQCAVWPVAYNPYIELASHPITTNCMNCHHRAAWPPRASFERPDENQTSSYLQTNTPNPNALEVYQWTSPVFNGLLILDSMWAISDRAGYPASSAR